MRISRVLSAATFLRRIAGFDHPKPKRVSRLEVEALEKRVLMTSVMVNTTVDAIFPPASGIVSLRNAIATANSSGSPTTITFDPTVFAAAKAIVLNGSDLELSNTSQPTTIVGTAAGVSISGNGASGVFEIDQGVTAALVSLTISACDVFHSDHA